MHHTDRRGQYPTRKDSQPRSRTAEKGPLLDLAQVEELVRKGVAEKMDEMESRRTDLHSRPLGIDDRPLSRKIYEGAMPDFKFLLLPSFRGSGDNQDPQSFICGFHEHLRLQGASDAITCRVFSTCLAGEAWELYMTLPWGSIRTFKDLAAAFLARYAAVRPPQATCDMLLDVRQGHKESTRRFVARFIQALRGIQSCSDEFSLVAIRKGL